MKKLLDEFNNSQVFTTMPQTKPNEEIFEKTEEKKEDNKINIDEQGFEILHESKFDYSFSEQSSSVREDEYLFIHFKDKVFKIKTKNLLVMRE